VTLPEPLNSYEQQSPASSSNKENGASRESPAPARAPLVDAGKLAPPGTQQSEKRPLALLLDLSGDKRASLEWAARELPGLRIQSINKTDLKWGSKREAVGLTRRLNPDVFAVFTLDLKTQSARSAMMLFGVLSGAGLILLGDANGSAIRRSRVSALAIEAPRFALELLFGYLVVVPLSWLLTQALSLSLVFRETARASRSSRATNKDAPLVALYVKAAPVGDSPTAAAGGMATHVTGFMNGALALGHKLKLVTSDDATLCDGRLPITVISPSSSVAPTRALFEIWNNLAFTARALGHLRALDALRQIDFIYQRYNRFNWTGVVLSLATGLPLALEFNGSEVWMSGNWDPVGLVWLLRRFERLNLKAADHIFVVSEVERRNLMAAGIAPNRVVVNPNGVDVERFRPDSGGDKIRLAAGVSDRIVVGFVGTFGPWHGAPVLADAAAQISESARCHFLFIGDGEQRSKVEEIIDSASNVSATFAGRIPHAEVPAYLDACDIFAAPNVRAGDGSEFFGSPTKLFEYMSMARPVVASRLGQIADVIEDGSNGVLVEPGDAHSLARAIEKLAADKGLRARLGAAARQTVIERYTWRHNAARVFDTMLSRGEKKK
jgi:glycosyltransferase involved in cell wall biosynthesis